MNTSNASAASASPSARAPARPAGRPRCRTGPSARTRCSSASASVVGTRPRRAASSQSRSPGSTDPERVAITSPSSGVNPIVVSTHARPRRRPATRRRRGGRRRSAGPRAVPADDLGAAPHGIRVATARGTRTAAAASARSTPSAAHRCARRPAGRRGTSCRSRRPPGTSGSSRRTARIAGDRARVVQRREVRRWIEVGEHVVVDRAPTSVQPWAAVNDAVPDRLDVVDLLDELADRVQSPRRPSARRSCGHVAVAVDDGELEAARSGVDHQDVHGSASGSERSVVTRGRRSTASPGSPACPRRATADVDPVLDQLVLQLLARRARGGLQPRHPVDHVHREVEPVDLVHHGHVERAWWWCPPPCSRARGGWRGWCAGRSAGGSATGSRGRRR